MISVRFQGKPFNVTVIQVYAPTSNTEEIDPKQKQHPVVDMTGDGSKVQCVKEQDYIGIWNVRSMNQGELEVIKQEMARVNIDILEIS